MPTVPSTVLPVLMLFGPHIFTTFAWYGHLKYKDHWLPAVIMASWGIAFFDTGWQCPPIAGAVRSMPPPN